MKTANLALAFVLELIMLAAWVWGGLTLPLPEPGPALAAVLIPLTLMVVWGAFAAPRAAVPLPVPATVALKGILLASGVGALAAAGAPLLAGLYGALVVLNLTLAVAWKQFDRPPTETLAGSLRQSLEDLLADYLKRNPGDAGDVARFREFAASGEELQGKSNLGRHITASTWIVNPTRTRVLLTHHAKLHKWVQLGGHTDEGEDWAAAALREAVEESGLAGVRLAQPGIFDLDIHRIPARADTPAHFHYDLRFLVEADDSVPLVISEESRDLAWVDLARLEDYTTEHSQLKMRTKTPRMPSSSTPSL